MNPWTMLASVLQQLPTPVRRTIYSLVTAAGAVLAIAQLAGWKTLAGLDVDTAMKVYALVASPTGVLALANTDGKRDLAGEADFGGGGPHAAFDDGWDAWQGFAGMRDVDDRDDREFSDVDATAFEVDGFDGVDTLDDDERAFT